MTASERELAERLGRSLRHVVLMLRRVGADQPVTGRRLSVLGSLGNGPRRMTEPAAGREHRVDHLAGRLARMTDEERAAPAAVLPVLGKLFGAP